MRRLILQKAQFVHEIKSHVDIAGILLISKCSMLIQNLIQNEGECFKSQSRIGWGIGNYYKLIKTQKAEYAQLV